jgi:vanillate/4-hydroxybenzoate decarboxylase subunit D
MMDESWPHETSVVHREPVEGTCPRCGGTHLERYPVLSDGGWFEVTKCQGCLHSLERTPWNRLGYVALIEDVML